MVHSDVPYSPPIATFASKSPEELAVLCLNTTRYKAFTWPAGELKACASCAISSDCCIYPQGQPFPAADSIDLYVDRGLPPPVEWSDDLNTGTLLYASPEPTLCYMPEVGNGFIASVVGFASAHSAGLYDGACGGVHKARLPSPIAGMTVTNVQPKLTRGGLDTARGMYRRRYHLLTNNGSDGGEVEQRIYAHRTRKHIMISEFELITPSTTGATVLNMSTLYSPKCGKASHAPAGQCANPGGKMVKRPDGSEYPYFGLGCIRGSDCGNCFVDNNCTCCSRPANSTPTMTAVTCCMPLSPTPTCSNTPDCPTNGNGCAGSFGIDFTFEEMQPVINGTTLFVGTTINANEVGDHDMVALTVSNTPQQITLSVVSTRTVLVCVFVWWWW